MTKQEALAEYTNLRKQRVALSGELTGIQSATCKEGEQYRVDHAARVAELGAAIAVIDGKHHELQQYIEDLSRHESNAEQTAMLAALLPQAWVAKRGDR